LTEERVKLQIRVPREESDLVDAIVRAEVDKVTIAHTITYRYATVIDVPTDHAWLSVRAWRIIQARPAGLL
jgi:hypothetical protein